VLDPSGNGSLCQLDFNPRAPFRTGAANDDIIKLENRSELIGTVFLDVAGLGGDFKERSIVWDLSSQSRRW
jgi:hypothetical protein